MSTLDPNASPDWRRHLAGLPEVAPDESLWLRLQAARAARSRVSRPARRGSPRAWASAAAVVGAIALLAALRAPIGVPDTRDASVATVAPAGVAAPMDAGLLQIDADIERAYARGADAAEVAELWATRQRVALGLDGAAPVLVARL